MRDTRIVEPASRTPNRRGPLYCQAPVEGGCDRISKLGRSLCEGHSKRRDRGKPLDTPIRSKGKLSDAGARFWNQTAYWTGYDGQPYRRKDGTLLAWQEGREAAMRYWRVRQAKGPCVRAVGG